jgi:predicted 3-demethylubiquinone-9 3-methyltransferase (glyoxalase superfamily)
MRKITPHLWFDKEAVEAAKFYVATFPNSTQPCPSLSRAIRKRRPMSSGASYLKAAQPSCRSTPTFSELYGWTEDKYGLS